MQTLRVGVAFKEAAELWAQHWVKLLPVGVAVHTFAFALALGFERLLELHPLIGFVGALPENAPLGEFFRYSLAWLVGPVGAAIFGGGLVFLLWSAWCLLGLQGAQGTLSALSGVLPRAGVLLRRFVVGALITAAMLLVTLAAAVVLGGAGGRVVLGVGLILTAWICWPRWFLLAPVTLKQTGGFFPRYRALAPPPVRRVLFLVALASFALGVLVSVPAALVTTFSSDPLLLGSVLIPFHAALAPLQAFLQARAYAQIAG